MNESINVYEPSKTSLCHYYFIASRNQNNIHITNARINTHTHTNEHESKVASFSRFWRSPEKILFLNFSLHLNA